MTRFLILAQGNGERWHDANGRPYLGVAKHFVTVDGETLLERTVRLLRERGQGDVVVVGPDSRYAMPGARLVTLEATEITGCDMDKLLGTRHLWADADAERTTILWGDCFYSDVAMDMIVGADHPDWHIFRRPGASKTTGHRWDESFALTWPVAENERVEATARRVADWWRQESRARPKLKTHMRTLLAAMAGLPPARWDQARNVADVGGQTHIDDWTDDIDSPAEWRQFMGRFYAGRHRVVVCIPWLGDDGAGRGRLLDFVRRHYEQLGVPVVLGGQVSTGLLNRSAARNDAARRAAEVDPEWEVLFFADADTFVAGDQMWAAAHLATSTGRLVLAFSEYVRLKQIPSRNIMRGRPIMPGAKRGATIWRSHASGANAVSRAVWEATGGFDERFVGWGAEDRAFWLAANTLCGEADRIDGTAWHLWHARTADKNRNDAQYHANVALGMRYKVAAGIAHQTGALPKLVQVGPPDPDAMRAILHEAGAPLGPALEPAGDVVGEVDAELCASGEEGEACNLPV